MKPALDITCPVSGERINENGARVAAWYTILVVVPAVAFSLYLPFAFLAADFGLRAFTNGRFSPLRLLSRKTAQLLKLENIPVDAAPKKFAAGMGFAFSLLIGAALFFQLPLLAFVSSAVLVLCALLEGAFAYCLGCVVYSLLLRLFSRTKETYN